MKVSLKNGVGYIIKFAIQKEGSIKYELISENMEEVVEYLAKIHKMQESEVRELLDNQCKNMGAK